MQQNVQQNKQASRAQPSNVGPGVTRLTRPTKCFSFVSKLTRDAHTMSAPGPFRAKPAWFSMAELYLLCLYGISLWNKFLEPCEKDHCASARTHELWRVSGALPNAPKTWNPSHLHARRRPWDKQSFSYGFLGSLVAIHSSRTISSKPTQKREPKRIYQSRHIKETPSILHI